MFFERFRSIGVLANQKYMSRKSANRLSARTLTRCVQKYDTYLTKENKSPVRIHLTGLEGVGMKERRETSSRLVSLK
jgi:hypothetical protein